MDSDWHRLAINLLVEVIDMLNHGRSDYFASGNMFVYYSSQQVKTMGYRGPDVFYVKKAQPKEDRKYWAIWDEGGRYPDVIFELLSPSTARVDRTTKKDLCE